jgi:hypothetical protein
MSDLNEILIPGENVDMAALRDHLIATTAYLPDQADFVGSIAVGDGLRNLARTSGEHGRYNSTFGIDAGESLTSGYYNTLIGWSAGKAMAAHNHASSAPYAGGTLGNVGNTFIGWQAAMVAQGALDNTGVGTKVMLNLTNGMDNAALGINALQDIEGGCENAAMGHGALQHLVGSGINYATGVGHRNTAVGDMAGRFLNGGLTNKTGGKGSCYIGARTTSSGNAVVNENVFGYGAAGAGSNTSVYGNADITEHRFPGGAAFFEDLATTAGAPNAYIDPSTGELRRMTGGAWTPYSPPLTISSAHTLTFTSDTEYRVIDGDCVWEGVIDVDSLGGGSGHFLTALPQIPKRSGGCPVFLEPNGGNALGQMTWAAGSTTAVIIAYSGGGAAAAIPHCFRAHFRVQP